MGEDGFVFRLAILWLALIPSVIFHEMAHAWSALKMGDPTGENDNRLSWNPIYHIDIWMTILLPLILYIGSSGQFIFGGAKPVQINPLNFKHPGRGMMISSAMGPISNYFLAVLSFAVFYALYHWSPAALFGAKFITAPSVTPGGYFLFSMIMLNMILGTFNLIPIPPLDGSRILRYLLPRQGKEFLDRIEPSGMIILILIIAMGGFGIVLRPVIELIANIMFNAFRPDLILLYFKVFFQF
jgi:Zn-dependent protease